MEIPTVLDTIVDLHRRHLDLGAPTISDGESELQRSKFPTFFDRSALTVTNDRDPARSYAVIRSSAPGCELSVTTTVPLPVANVVLA
jgi:hypothetical protein